MVDVYRAIRQFERFLFKSKSKQITENKDKGELIATIIYKPDKEEIEIVRADKK